MIGKFKKKDMKKRVRRFPVVPKKCIFCEDGVVIDYKNIEVIRRFLNVKGRITSRRVNGNCLKHQRKLAEAIKISRFLALLPYTGK